MSASTLHKTFSPSGKIKKVVQQELKTDSSIDIIVFYSPQKKPPGGWLLFILNIALIAYSVVSAEAIFND